MVATTLAVTPLPASYGSPSRPLDVRTPGPSHAAPVNEGARTRAGLRLLADAGLVLTGALLLGGLTSWGQTVLPDAARPFANSASGWTLLAVALICWQHRGRRTGMPASALLGTVAFTGLSVGYALISTARGFSFDPTFWIIVGLLAGPVVGAATALARSRRTEAGAVGVGVLAGLLAGDGLSGLVTVADTTGWEYWAAAMLLGALGVVTSALDQARAVHSHDSHGGERFGRVGLLVATAVGVTAAYPLAFAVLGGAIV